MGCFDVKCSLTGLPIIGDQEIGIIYTIRDIYTCKVQSKKTFSFSEDDWFIHDPYPADRLVIASDILFGKYDSYGSINQGSSSPSTHTFYEEIYDKFYTGDIWNKDTPIYFHKKAFDHLKSLPVDIFQTDSKTGTFYETIHENIKEHLSKVKSYMFSLDKPFIYHDYLKTTLLPYSDSVSFSLSFDSIFLNGIDQTIDNKYFSLSRANRDKLINNLIDNPTEENFKEYESFLFKSADLIFFIYLYTMINSGYI